MSQQSWIPYAPINRFSTPHMHPRYFKNLFLSISNLSRALQISKPFHFTTSKYLSSQKTVRTTLPVRAGARRELSHHLTRCISGKRTQAWLMTFLSEGREQNFELPGLPNGPPTQATHATPRAVIRFDEDPLVNFLSHCFVGSTEACAHLSNGHIPWRKGPQCCQEEKVIWLRRLMLKWHPTLWSEMFFVI